jgi:hypothetical protein
MSDGYQSMTCDMFAKMVADCRRVAEAVGRSV